GQLRQSFSRSWRRTPRRTDAVCDDVADRFLAEDLLGEAAVRFSSSEHAKLEIYAETSLGLQVSVVCYQPYSLSRPEMIIARFYKNSTVP
uniref:START domain-containing protein n=1 Tax=Steinernema glaseri TaxID=37863 RepID=A0A1I7Y426_9BILA